MPDFTLPNGETKAIDASAILHLRRAIYKEVWSADGAHRDGAAVYAPARVMVLETVDAAGAAARVENPALVALTARDGSPLWVNAGKAADAESPGPTDTDDEGRVRSVVRVGPLRLRCRETVDEAQAALAEGRGAGSA